MFILTLLALFFVWLLYREVVGVLWNYDTVTSFDIVYSLVLVGIIFLLAWQPITYWKFESFLEKKGKIISGQPTASVECDTLFDSILNNAFSRAGHARPDTKEMWMDYPNCKYLNKFLNDPDKYLSKTIFGQEAYSLAVFNHELMHVRGEWNEQRTECQSVQRNYSSAKIMGLTDSQAINFAVRYYQEIYPRHGYFTSKCQPDGEYDEKLIDSSWNHLS